MTGQERSEVLSAVVEAHSNLNVFATILSSLENSIITGPESSSARKTEAALAKLCRAEIRRQHSIYEKKLAEAKSLMSTRIDVWPAQTRNATRLAHGSGRRNRTGEAA